MADQLDKNGMRNIYLKRQGGREWFMGDIDPDNDPQLECNKEIIKLVDNYYKLRNNEEASVDILIPEYSAAPPDSDHSAAVARGWMTSPSDWGDAVEFTVMFNANKVVPNTNPFGMQGPTGEHPTNHPDCTGSGYGCFVLFYRNPITVLFCKEMFHQQFLYTPEREVPEFNFELNAHGDIGNKFIIFLKYGPDRNFVHLEHWMNGNGDKVTWVKVNEITDTGENYGYDSTCGGSGDQIINYRNGKMRLFFDWSDTDIKFKYLSVREVTKDPNEIPTEPPVVIPPPQAGTFRRIYSIIYDMGAFQGNECLIEPTTPTCPEGQHWNYLTNECEDDSIPPPPPPPPPAKYEIYNVAQNGSDKDSLQNDNFRCAIYLYTSSSVLIGEIPCEITWFLEKDGSPPSEPITCHIRRGTDDAIVETFDWESGTLTADLLTTSMAAYKFVNDEASYILQQGDMITVEWTGGESGSGDRVEVAENETGPFNGTNTCERRFNSGGTPPDSWGSPDTTQDYAAIIKAWET